MINIKTIEFINDKIFGNQKFDFTINGKTASTIVLAGKNGVGKTKLLEYIYNLSNLTIFYSKLLGETNSIIKLEFINEGIHSDEKEVIDTAVIYRKLFEGKYQFEIEYYCGAKKVKQAYKTIDGNEVILMFQLKSIFSPVDITYEPTREVKTVSDKKLDLNDTSIPKDLASEIIQLLVDIKTQDNNDLAEYNDEYPDKIIPESKKNIRINRFNKAFYHIFNKKLKFKGLENNIKPVFLKGDNRIYINDLSSGEKQIVFRGSYLLRNIDALKGIPVLIDEPELSMHPSWNKNIYDFYRRLFKTDKGEITSQMFIATHSEYVIESALDDNNCLIIKMDEKRNKKYNKNIKNSIMGLTTFAEIRNSIFDVKTTDYHIQLYSYIQNYFVGEDAFISEVDSFLIEKGSPEKKYSFINRNNRIQEYNSLCTYIRNCIDHPDNNHNYSKAEFEQSIIFMEKLIKENSI